MRKLIIILSFLCPIVTIGQRDFKSNTVITLDEVLAKANNLSDLTTPGTARTNLGGTTIGQNIFTMTNPGAITFPRYNADNTVTARTSAELKTDLGLVIGTNVQAYNAGTVLTGQANTYTAGMKQTFSGDATNAGIRFSGVSANPSTLVAGDFFYRTDLEKLSYQGASTTKLLVEETLVQTLTNKDLSSATNTLPSTQRNSLLNADANTVYTDNATYYGRGTTANGFPVNGVVTGSRIGTVGTQRIQDEVNGSTYARAWLNGTTVWSAWAIYLDANDFTAKGQMHVGTGSNAVAVISPGADGTFIVANSGVANGINYRVLASADIPNNAANTSGTAGSLSAILSTALGGTGVDNSTGGTANQFWARPNGATGAATYRAIVAADIPTLNQSTTGTANISGGTVGAIPYQSGAGATTVLASTATAGQMFRSGASAAPTWSTATFPNTSAISGSFIRGNGTNYTESTIALPNAATTGDIMLGTGTNVFGVLAAVATGSFLTSAGTSTLPTYLNTRGNYTSFAVATSDVTTTGQTMVDITGLVSGTLTNSTTYEVEAMLYVGTSAVVTGTQYAITGGGSGTAATVFATQTGTTTTNAGSTFTQAVTAVGGGTFLTTASAFGIVWIKGIITTRGSGTANISIQHLKVTSGTSTVKIGSYMKIRLLN